MKKKITAVFTALALTMTLTACSSNYDFITLPEYIGLHIETINEYSVSNSEIDERINSILASNLVNETITDRAIKNDDIVNVDLDGTVDGNSFSNSSVTGYDFKIGTNALIDGFDDALIGKNIGDTFVVSLKFPSDHYNQEVAGKPVVYNVKINSIRSQITPELNNTFVKTISDTATTVAEFRLEVEKSLESEKASTNSTSIQTQLWSTIMATVEVGDIPNSMLNDEIERIENQYLSMAELSAMTLEQYVSTNVGIDADTFKAQNITMAEYNIKERGTIYKIAENESLIPTEDEYIEHYQSMLSNYGFTTVEALLDVVSEDDLKTSILSDIVKAFIVNNAVQVDAE